MLQLAKVRVCRKGNQKLYGARSLKIINETDRTVYTILAAHSKNVF